VFSGTQKYKGEKHAPQLTKKGVEIGNYIGPGTNIITRLRDFNNNQPKTFTDHTSMAHDIRYSLAKSNKDIRDADNKMLKTLKRGQKENKDHNLNIQMGMKGIQSKTLFEDITGKKGLFGGVGEDKGFSKRDEQLMRGHLANLEQQGFGMFKKRKTKALYNTQIDKMLKHIPHYKGCYSKDLLNKVKTNKKKKMCVVVNMDDSDGGGTHWCCLEYNPKRDYSFYFDSFGLEPPREAVALLKKYKKPIYYNRDNLQDARSNRCGYYCIEVLQHLHNGYKPDQILSTFTPDPSYYNEEKVINPKF